MGEIWVPVQFQWQYWHSFESFELNALFGVNEKQTEFSWNRLANIYRKYSKKY